MKLDTKIARTNASERITARAEQQLSFWEAAAPAAPVSKKHTKAAVTQLVKNVSPKVSSKVGNEIITGKLRPATWAMALAFSNGSHDQAITHYARLRLEELADSNNLAMSKELALEARRRAGFKKMRTPVPKLYLHPLSPGGFRNRRRALSPLWLAGLWLSVTGACAGVTRFYSEKFDDPAGRLSIPGSLGIAAIIIVGVLIIHQLVPRYRRVLRYGVPAGAWVAASISFYFGLMLLRDRGMHSNDAADTRNQTVVERMIMSLPETSKLSPEHESRPSKTLAEAGSIPDAQNER